MSSKLCRYFLPCFFDISQGTYHHGIMIYIHGGEISDQTPQESDK